MLTGTLLISKSSYPISKQLFAQSVQRCCVRDMAASVAARRHVQLARSAGAADVCWQRRDLGCHLTALYMGGVNQAGSRQTNHQDPTLCQKSNNFN